MNKLDKLVENYFIKRKNRLSADMLFKLIEEEINLFEEKIAGLEIKTNKSPANSGDVAEGIFILGLLSAMKNGASEPNDIRGMINQYRHDVKDSTLRVNIDYTGTGGADPTGAGKKGKSMPFGYYFDEGVPIKVQMIIKLHPHSMAALFIPLDKELPMKIDDLANEHIPILDELRKVVSGNNRDWEELFNIIMNKKIPTAERQKALDNLRNKKHEAQKRETGTRIAGAAAFWNKRGAGHRGYIDFANEVLNQIDPNTGKTLQEVGAMINIVADGVSENLTTTADAYIKIGDMSTGAMLFSYSLKSGSDQIAQYGSPFGKTQWKKSGDEKALSGGGVERIFVRFALPDSAMPSEAKAWFGVRPKPTFPEFTSAFIKRYVDKTGASEEEAWNQWVKIHGFDIKPASLAIHKDKTYKADSSAVKEFVEMWNKVSEALVGAWNDKFNDADSEEYEVILISGLAIMITKTIEEQDMEYVNIGKDAKSTLRAFPSLMPNYVKHFSFEAKEGAGNVLSLPSDAKTLKKELTTGYAAIQPQVNIRDVNKITRENLDKSGFVIKIDEIKKNLSRSPDYFENILDMDSSMGTMFAVNPELEEKYLALRGEYSKNSDRTIKKNATKLAYKEMLAGANLKDLVKLLDDHILDMVIHKLNDAMPVRGQTVFLLRLRPRYRHGEVRTYLQKEAKKADDGLGAIMRFVKYAKWLKYEAAEEVLAEIENIIAASAAAIKAAEEALVPEKT